jgi:long-subunit fatty acid transport protein
VKHSPLVLALALLLSEGTAHAGAFYLPERGARALSLGGAFIAGVDDLNAQWLNPAGLTRLSHDLELSLDFGLIFSDQRFARLDSPEVMRKDPTLANGFPEVSDEGGPFPDPSLAAAFRLTPDLVLAFGIYGPYAGTNTWPEDGPQRYSLINLQALEVFGQVSLAWRPSPHLSIGLGLQWVVTGVTQRLKISAYPGVFGWAEQRDLDVLAEVQVTDAFSPSGNLGLIVTPTSGATESWNLDIGLSVQLPVHADASGSLEVQKPGHYYFSTTTIEGDKIDVSLDFPWILRGGVRLYDPTWSFELAAVAEFWSTLDRISVAPGEGGVAFVGVPGIGTYSVKPFDIKLDYRDIVSLRFGTSFTPARGPLTLRAGAFYESGAPPESTLSVLDIDGDKLGLTLGGTLELGAFEVDLSLGWIETFDRTVNSSEKAQVNPIYLADPGPYGDGDPTYVGNGTYAARNIILATTLSAGF